MLSLSEGINILFGENGSGKTTLIEAIYLLGTFKSFRTHKNAEMIREGDVSSEIVGKFQNPQTDLQLILNPKRRELFKNGNKPESLMSYLSDLRLVALAPE